MASRVSKLCIIVRLSMEIGIDIDCVFQQTRPVTIVRYVCTETIEEKVLELQVLVENGFCPKAILKSSRQAHLNHVHIYEPCFMFYYLYVSRIMDFF